MATQISCYFTVSDYLLLILDMKITTLVGARPQFIKAAAVSRILRANSNINEILIHTGQYYDPNLF